MPLKDEVVKYLKEQPLFRERKNKDRGLVNLLTKRYSALGDVLREGRMSKEELVQFVRDYATADREWRQALEEDPRLRGADYGDKERLTQKKMLGLGYTPGYKSDRSKLKTL